MKGRICAVHTRTRKGKELEKDYAALSKEVNRSTRRVFIKRSKNSTYGRTTYQSSRISTLMGHWALLQSYTQC